LKFEVEIHTLLQVGGCKLELSLKIMGVIQTANLATVCRGEQAAAPSFFERVDARSIVLDSISADPTIAKAPGGSALYAPASLRQSAAVGNLRFSVP